MPPSPAHGDGRAGPCIWPRAAAAACWAAPAPRPRQRRCGSWPRATAAAGRLAGPHPGVPAPTGAWPRLAGPQLRASRCSPPRSSARTLPTGPRLLAARRGGGGWLARRPAPAPTGAWPWLPARCRGLPAGAWRGSPPPLAPEREDGPDREGRGGGKLEGERCQGEEESKR